MREWFEDFWGDFGELLVIGFFGLVVVFLIGLVVVNLSAASEESFKTGCTSNQGTITEVGYILTCKLPDGTVLRYN